MEQTKSIKMNTKFHSQVFLVNLIHPLQIILRSTLILITLLLITNQTIAKTREKSLIAKGAKPEKLAGDFKFTEGPACDPEGNVFFTDQPNNRIMKWSTDNK